MRRRIAGLLIAALLLVAGIACGPEASRTRGGGPGADIGNKTSDVRMHGQTTGERSIYFDTPVKIDGE